MATTSHIVQAQTPAWAGARARLGPVAVALLLIVLAMGFNATIDWQNGVSQTLSAEVRTGVDVGSFASLTVAGMAFGLWLAWLLARSLVFSAIFLVVEFLLVGPPKNWRDTGFRVAVQVAFLMFFQLIGPVLFVALPNPLPWSPLIGIEQTQLAGQLGLFAPVLLALLSLLLFDFMGYWVHRALHTVPFLWRFHSVHHSMTDLDSLAYIHPADVICQRVGAMVISLAVGLQFETFALIVAFQSIHERLLHSRAPINFGILGAVLVDNRRHFVHHTIIDAHAGCNFAGIFTFCDRLFGTYRAPYPDWNCPTGLRDRLPPRTLRQYFLARLDDRRVPAGD